jgi:SAM-dependent methyltransferase
MRKCLAGPFIGEFGWELFCWQGFLRKRRSDYDSMTVICRKGHSILYADFADEVIEIDIPVDNVNEWMNRGFDPNQTVNYYKSAGEFTDFIPFNAFKSWWWKNSSAWNRQIFKALGQKHDTLKTDILIHARNAHHYGSSYRNWKQPDADLYGQWASSQGYSIASIGLSQSSTHISAGLDYRDKSLAELADIMASSRLLIGSQSGPTHYAALCKLPVIAWQQSSESAVRVERHWNPFNVETRTKPADIVLKAKRESFTPPLEWMQDATLDILKRSEVRGNGLSQDEIRRYWDDRSSKQDACTVGPYGSSLREQDNIYQERFAFMQHRMPFTYRTLDFGCGIGRCSSLFDSAKYLGVDICSNLIELAKTRNPGYEYKLLGKPLIEDIDFVYDCFFTSTVLQHNDDASVVAIFKSVKQSIRGRPLTLCLYENTSENPNKAHICFRSVTRYEELIRSVFSIENFDSWSHISYRERHSLMVARVK